ncbi:MAG: flavin monoamine oxidase family protein, partial [Candidatus Binatia bacterium]
DIRELLDSTDFGESIRHVSGFAALAEYAESSEHNEMDFKIVGGNSRLVEKLVEKVGADRIKLDHEAISVSYAGKRVVVTVQIGGKAYENFEADQLVCAIPTFALHRIAWKPVFPEDKLWALDALQYARIHKTALVFDEKVWKEEDFDMVTDLYGHYFYNATKNQPSKKGALIAYVCGDKADVIGRQDEDFRRQVVLDTLKPAFGDVSKLISKQVSYYWGNDPYSKGAYALYGNGQWFGLMPAMKKSVGRVHFAGEHVADWQGFMEGAVVSGEEAAEAVMG